MEDICAICRTDLSETEGELCVACQSKYGIAEEDPSIGKMRKKKREE